MNDVVNIRRIANEEIDKRLGRMTVDQAAAERQAIIELIHEAAAQNYAGEVKKFGGELVESIRARDSQ